MKPLSSKAGVEHCLCLQWNVVGVLPGRRPKVGLCVLVAAWICLVLICVGAFAEDWPTYRHDNARSGVTTERLSLPLSPCWLFEPQHAPEPAWGDPNPRPVGGWYHLTELRRVHFDDVFHVVVAGSMVYFGSSADGKVYALDAATGRLRWSTLTGGPVRLAPTVYKEKIYVGSDDGWVYCFQASDGQQVWRFAAAPSRQKLLGSGKMISLWPVRTGVLVDDGIAYFGAGIFPAEGTYMYAVRAEDGQLVWCNDTCGAAPQSRISPQGYLLASKDTLFAPMGRVPPAAFDRSDGHLHYQTAFGHQIGGTYALLADDYVFTGTEQLATYPQESPGQFAYFDGRQLIVTPEASYMATDRQLVALDRKSYYQASLRRQAAMKQTHHLNNSLGAARRNQQKLQAAVGSDKEALKIIDQRIAELAEKGNRVGDELQALKTEQAKANQKLQADIEALAAAEQQVAKLQESLLYLVLTIE